MSKIRGVLVATGLMLVLLTAVAPATEAAGHPQSLADVTGRVALVALATSQGPKPGVQDSVRLSVDRVFKGRATKTIEFAGKNVAAVMPAGSRWIILADTKAGVARGDYWRVLADGRITDVGVTENPGTVQALADWFASAPATSTQAGQGSLAHPSLPDLVVLLSVILWLAVAPGYLARHRASS